MAGGLRSCLLLADTWPALRAAAACLFGNQPGPLQVGPVRKQQLAQVQAALAMGTSSAAHPPCPGCHRPHLQGWPAQGKSKAREYLQAAHLARPEMECKPWTSACGGLLRSPKPAQGWGKPCQAHPNGVGRRVACAQDWVHEQYVPLSNVLHRTASHLGSQRNGETVSRLGASSSQMREA